MASAHIPHISRTAIAAACTSMLLTALPAAAAAPHKGPALHAGRPAALSHDKQWAYDFAVPEPKRNAPPAKVALGERLFFDKKLSSDGTVSCATCHMPNKGFVDHLPVSQGVGQQKGQRNTPTVLNALLQEHQFWDGRAATLEDQAILPILNPIEMGMKSGEDVEAVLRANPQYVADFKQIYGELSFAHLADAITAYERTQIKLHAPYDDFIDGDKQALRAAERRGMDLFNGKARCTDCHGANNIAPLFSDQKFHNIGIAAHKANFSELAKEAAHSVDSANQQQVDEMALQSKFSELGRFLVSKDRQDIGAFKTQTLRNIGITAPYMHDGSLPTLWDVVDHYNRGGIANPYLDGGIQRLGLTEPEIDDLVAFLFALTDYEYDTFNSAEHRRQHAQAQKHRPQRDTAAAMGKKGDFGDVGVKSEHKDMSRAGAY